MPFQPAAQLLKDMLGVVVSKAQAVRAVEAAGAVYVAYQDQEADRIEREAPLAAVKPGRLVLSADGAMVPLRGGEWGEVKTLAVGEVQAPRMKKGELSVQTKAISYFSRLSSAKQFEHLTLSELHRRGLENSAQVAAVMDGAEWLQGFVDYHCPNAVRILDFPHAGQRIGQVGQALWGEGTPAAQQWTRERLHQLKQAGPQPILEELCHLHQQQPECAVLAENLAYLEKRAPQMDYPRFQAQGWPIGSGMVESGNKLVVEARLKGAGMHWQPGNVNCLLGLRNIVCSDRWSEEWPLIARQLRKQARQRRNQNREQRRAVKALETKGSVEIMPAVERCVLPEKSAQEMQEKPVRQGPKKPAANHPWRHSPIGRARYQPSNSAKN